VPIDVDLGNVKMGAIRPLHQLLRCLSAALDYFFRIASQEDFAYGFSIGVVNGLSVGEMPRRVEGFGERKMLFRYDAS